jgi:hypothetical protein
LLCAPEWVGQIAVLLTKGAIKPIVDRIFPVAHFQSGIEYSEAGRDWGKIVVRLVDSLENVEHPLNKWIRRVFQSALNNTDLVQPRGEIISGSAVPRQFCNLS